MEDLLKAMKGLKVQTGSLACLGCGHEHNCSISGCAIIQDVIRELESREIAGGCQGSGRDFDGCLNLTEQDIIGLTNQAKRKAVLEAWREWPVWASVPEIGLTVRKLDLPGGRAFTASWYEGDEYVRTGCMRIVHEPSFHLIGHAGKLASGNQGWTIMIDELQALRKELLEARKVQ